MTKKAVPVEEPDQGFFETSDPLTLACRVNPEVLSWWESLRSVVDHALQLSVLAEKYLATAAEAPKSKRTSTKLIRCCRAIERDIRSIGHLDPSYPVAVAKRMRSPSASAMKLTGMDAAVHLGAWIIRGLADISVDSRPQRLRWAKRPGSGGVDWDRVKGRTSVIAAWIAENLSADLLSMIHAELRADLAWLCESSVPSRGRSPGSCRSVTSPSSTRLGSYEVERAEILQKGEVRALRAVLDQNGDLQKRSCQILQAIPVTGETSQTTVVARLGRKGITLTIGKVGHPMRAMVRLGLLSRGPKYSRTLLGSLFVEHCPEFDPTLKW